MKTFNATAINCSQRFAIDVPEPYFRDETGECFAQSQLRVMGLGEVADGIDAVDELLALCSRAKRINEEVRRTVLSNDEVLRLHLLKQRGIEVPLNDLPSRVVINTAYLRT